MSSGSDYLFSIKQKEGESFYAYLHCFNVVTLEVSNLDRSIAMIALKSILQRNPFLLSLEKMYPQNFAEMLTWIEKYTNAEKVYNAHPIPTKPKVEKKVKSSKRTTLEGNN